MGFVGNLVLYPLKIDKSYRHEFGVLLFWDRVYNHLLSTNSRTRMARLWALRVSPRHKHKCQWVRGAIFHGGR